MEEKTGKIQRTTQSSSTTSLHGNDRSQSDTIPLDLTIEILSRLPAKSIMRFRYVSNLWSAITTTPHFIRSFATPSLASRPSVLLIFKKDNLILVFSSPLHKNSPDGSVSCVGSYQLTNPNDSYLRCLNYVHGLICLKDFKQFVIWNPTLQSFFTLPKLEDTQDKDYRGGEVLVERNVGDEFRRCYGLGNNHIFKGYTMKVFPNHIETLVSL